MMNTLFKTKTKKFNAFAQLILFIAILLVLNIIGFTLYKRFDLTNEKRYSLSPTTIDLLQNLPDNVFLKVYLEGDLPPVFRKLRGSTFDMLSEMKRYAGSNLNFEFNNPSDNATQETTNNVFQQLLNAGLVPSDVQVKKQDALSRQTIWPGALLSYKDKELPINFINTPGTGVGQNFELMINQSEENLEFAIVNALKKISKLEKDKICFLQGNRELNAAQVYDLGIALKDYYDIEPYNIKKVQAIPQKYKLVVISKPDSVFTEFDKFKIDHYLMNGGSVLWLLDNVKAEMDSMNAQNFFMAPSMNLNLEDQLFKYGARVNPFLVQDLKCSQIPVVIGQQQELFPWYYYVVSTTPVNAHPIAKNIDPVWFRFANTIDTIENNIKKTVLLTSSQYSKTLFAPVRVNLGLIRDVGKPEQFTKSNQILALLLEGSFTSLYKNRDLGGFANKTIDSLGMKRIDESKPTRMVIVADGDVIRNDISNVNNNIFPLGYDKFTKSTFGNKAFIQNTIDYLVGDTELVNLRSREITLRLLNMQAIKKERTKWQVINVGIPIALIFIFGFIQHFLRKRKYAKH